MQRRMQQAAIDRLGLVDTGVEHMILKSAWSGHTGDDVPPALSSSEMQKLIAAEADVILVGYTSRFMRSQVDAGNLIRDLHARGKVLYVAADDLLSTRDYDRILEKVHAGWVYSRDLSNTVSAATREKWEIDGLPNGPRPFGFAEGWKADPDHAPTILALYEQYLAEDVSYDKLGARHGIHPDQVREILSNPAYAGWAQRHGERVEGSMERIVDRGLWNAVREKRASRTRTQGRRPARPSFLRGRLFCQCGTKIILDGAHGRPTSRRHYVSHHEPLCEAWGEKVKKPTDLFEEPVKEAIRHLQPTQDLIRRVTAALPRPTAPLDMSLARKKAATDFMRTRDLEAFTARVAEIDAMEAAERPVAPVRTEEDVRAWYDQFRTLPGADDEAWTVLANQLFSRYEYRGPDRIRFSLTDMARWNFLPVPPKVEVGGSFGGRWRAGARSNSTTRIVWLELDHPLSPAAPAARPASNAVHLRSR